MSKTSRSYTAQDELANWVKKYTKIGDDAIILMIDIHVEGGGMAEIRVGLRDQSAPVIIESTCLDGTFSSDLSEVSGE